jgi:hypothetical protein
MEEEGQGDHVKEEETAMGCEREEGKEADEKEKERECNNEMKP